MHVCFMSCDSAYGYHREACMAARLPLYPSRSPYTWHCTALSPTGKRQMATVRRQQPWMQFLYMHSVSGLPIIPVCQHFPHSAAQVQPKAPSSTLTWLHFIKKQGHGRRRSRHGPCWLCLSHTSVMLCLPQGKQRLAVPPSLVDALKSALLLKKGKSHLTGLELKVLKDNL